MPLHASYHSLFGHLMTAPESMPVQNLLHQPKDPICIYESDHDRIQSLVLAVPSRRRGYGCVQLAAPSRLPKPLQSTLWVPQCSFWCSLLRRNVKKVLVSSILRSSSPHGQNLIISRWVSEACRSLPPKEHVVGRVSNGDQILVTQLCSRSAKTTWPIRAATSSQYPLIECCRKQNEIEALSREMRDRCMLPSLTLQVLKHVVPVQNSKFGYLSLSSEIKFVAIWNQVRFFFSNQALLQD